MSDWKLPYRFEYKQRMVRFDIKGQGEPLVLVHGTPWSSFNFRHLIKELSRFYTIYYYDLLGYGQSDKSNADVSLGIQNTLLNALLAYWELKQPFILGHDFGGTTVLRSHILNKQSYKKIALIDPVAISPWGSSLFKHIKKYQKAFAGVPDYIHTAIVEAYVQTASHHKLDQETLNGILKPWSGDQGKSAFYRQIAQADVAFTNEFQNKFSEIESKVLILWGEEDQWIPCEQAYLLQRKIKHSKLVTIPGSGHLIIEEKPVDLALEIMSFFES